MEKKIEIKMKQVEEEDIIKEEKRNSPLFILALGLLQQITLFWLVPITFRVINIVVTGREMPTPEARKWLSMCFMVTHISGLLVSKPIGILCDIYGRRFVYLFSLMIWFVRLLTSVLALYFMMPSLLLLSAFLNGSGLSSLWIPNVILKDLLPQEKVSIWYTYLFVGGCICQVGLYMGIGLLADPKFGKVDLLYLQLCPCVIAFILLIIAIFYLIESKPTDMNSANYSWKDFIFISDIYQMIKADNVGILFIVMFLFFWGQVTFIMDKDNFMQLHFGWTILQTGILSSIAAAVNLILFPWGLTVNYFSDNFLINSALICQIIGFISIAISRMVGVWAAYVGGVFEAMGALALPLLKSTLTSHKKIGERFGGAFTLRSIAGVLTGLFSYFYRNYLQGKSGILPSLHFIISAILILVGFIVFGFYKNEHSKVFEKDDLLHGKTYENDESSSI